MLTTGRLASYVPLTVSRRRLVCVSLLACVLIVGGSASSAPAATPVSGGTLNVVAEQSAPINPYASYVWTAYETSPVILGAFQQAPDGTWQPKLVTSVDVATGPFTLTYHIAPAASWNDGQPVTADDFIFTWQTIMDPANSSLVASTAGYDQIASMTALDSKTVRVTFDSVVAYWKELFGAVLPKHALSGRNFTTVWNNGIVDPSSGQPIGDGPFLVTGYSSTQTTLSRNPHWWGPHAPYLSSIVFHVIATSVSAEAQALTSGQDQVIYPTVNDSLASLRTTPGVAVQAQPSASLERIDMNVASGGPLEDQAWARQAIADAIDRQAVAESVFPNLFPSLSPAQSLIYYPSQAGTRPTSRPTRTA